MTARTRERILYPFTEEGLQQLGQVIQKALDESKLTKVAFAARVCEAAEDNVLDIHSLNYLLAAGDPKRGSGGKNFWRLKYLAPFTRYSESELLQIAMGKLQVSDMTQEYLPLLEPKGARRLRNLIEASALVRGGWQEEEFVFAGVDRYIYQLATMQGEKDLTRVQLSIAGASPLAAVLYQAEFEGEVPHLDTTRTYELRSVELWEQLGNGSPKLVMWG
jgi:hypothetical protein